MSENNVPPPKIPAEDLLRTPAPRPTRYKKNLITGLTLGAVVCIGGALTYGLFAGPHQTGGNNSSDQNTTPAQQTPDVFGDFPTGYAQVTAPPKPPPLPPAPKATIQPRQSMQANAGDQGSDGGDNSDEPETEAQKATNSGIFFSNTTDQSVAAQLAANPAPTPPTPQIVPTSATGTGAASSTAAASADSDPGQQNEKNSFIGTNASSQAATSDYTGTPLETPASPYEVQAGAVIPAALLTVINSDLPGDVTAQVTENVYDSATGNYLLIPQGSRLYGKYDSLVSYAQNRVLVVWNRLIFPNGNSIDLGGMIGTDETGQSGIQDQVNRHILGLTAALATATLVSFGPALALDVGQSGGSGSTNIYTDPAQTLGQSTNNIGQEFVSKELNRPNTITIRAGWPLRVMVNKDMILEPYKP
jgi:type IV secretion system protein VirB10